MNDERQAHAREQRQAQAFSRLLLALDASADSRQTIEMAARLAAGLQSSLAALFVEEQDLMQFAGLPFARAYPLGGPGARKLDPDTVAQHLRAAATLARRSVETAARARRLDWSFDVVRGRRQAEIAAKARSGDVVALVRRAGLLGAADPIEAALHLLGGDGAGALLLLGERAARRRLPIALPVDTSAAALRAVRLAARIAAQSGDRLLLLPPADAPLQALAERVRPVLGALPLEFGPAVAPRAEALLHALAEVEPELLVLPGALAQTMGAAFADCLARCRCSVLVLRAELS